MMVFIMRKLWNLGILALCSVLPVAANAAEVGSTMILVTGTILPSSCNIAAGENKKSINLGTYANNALTTVGKVLTSKDLTVSLTGCNTGIVGTVVTFSGDADKDVPALLALSNPDATDTVQGLAVQISDSGGNIIPVNGQSSLQTLSPGNNTLKFKLAYKVTKIPVTPGNANAVLYMDMAYQ